MMMDTMINEKFAKTESQDLSLSEMPVEVLELVLSCLTDPISQRRLSQVRITMCGAVLLDRMLWFVPRSVGCGGTPWPG